MLGALALSLAGLAAGATVPAGQPAAEVWQPAVAAKWQIVIKNNISVDASGSLAPSDVDVFDVDLFNTPESVFEELHNRGKKAICYFSAGTGEDWRPDYAQFAAADLGAQDSCWPGERWLNVNSDSVWAVMAARIKLASVKGCDAIDPDNMDAYGNGDVGFALTQADAVAYLRKLSAEAAKYGMATGLKNAEELLPQVIPDVQFAVNEQCQMDGDCAVYNALLDAGKPVFHIEYTTPCLGADGESTLLGSSDPKLAGYTSSQLRDLFCMDSPGLGVGKTGKKPHGKAVAPVKDAPEKDKFSTIIKVLLLDGWAFYCDGSSDTTATMDVGTGGPSDGYCNDSVNPGNVSAVTCSP